MRQVVPGEAFVTTDEVAVQAVPGLNPALAVLHAEVHHVLQLRRLSADRVADLRERRKITATEAKAGWEIRAIMEWQDGMHAPTVRSQFRERLPGGGGEALWLLLAEAEGRHFKRWKDWSASFQVTARHTLCELTVAFVVEERGVEQVGKLLRIDRRRALALLRRSLSFYAFHAGWATRPEPEEIDQ